jgi:hypothetical protein
MPSKTFGSAVFGIEAITITIEVNISGGLNYFVVGLPDNAVKESMLRIESALNNSVFHMPRQRIIVNLAPADMTCPLPLVFWMPPDKFSVQNWINTLFLVSFPLMEAYNQLRELSQLLYKVNGMGLRGYYCQKKMPGKQQ